MEIFFRNICSLSGNYIYFLKYLIFHHLTNSPFSRFHSVRSTRQSSTSTTQLHVTLCGWGSGVHLSVCVSLHLLSRRPRLGWRERRSVPRNHGLSTETGREARHPQWERERGANTHELHQEGEGEQEESRLTTEKRNQEKGNFVLLSRYFNINQQCQFEMMHLRFYTSEMPTFFLLGLF